MDFNQVTDKPHAVCIPFPAQGHITPMLIKLAKLLHFKGFHITFVNTEYKHKRLLKSRGSSSLDGSTDFRFEAIPDGLPETDESDAHPRHPFSLRIHCRILLGSISQSTLQAQ